MYLSAIIYLQLGIEKHVVGGAHHFLTGWVSVPVNPVKQLLRSGRL